MATLLDFRRRIRSVKNTQQITRAMKFVAAARLRRAQEAALAARPYAAELARVLRSTMARIETPEHPLLAQAPREQYSGHRPYRRTRPGRCFQQQRAAQGARIFPQPRGQENHHDPGRQKGPRFAPQRGFHLCRRICKRSGPRGLQDRARNRQSGRRALHQGRNRLGLHHLQRIQERDGSDAGGRKTFARGSHSRGRRRQTPHGENEKAATARLPSTTFTSSPKNRFWQSCCRATSKRKSCAPCWNLPRPSTPRA